MKNALKILSNKNLGVLIVQNKNTIGIITDGQIKDLIKRVQAFTQQR